MKQPKDLELMLANKIPLNLTHQCRTEQGFDSDEIFHISEIIGAYEQLKIENQYGQTAIINPNQII